MCDRNEPMVTRTDHDDAVIGKQSRDFIDGFGQGIEHGKQMEREQAKYWEGFDHGLEQGMNHIRDVAVIVA